MVTAGKTDAHQERLALGCQGLASQDTPLAREDPHKLATEKNTGECPQGRAKAGEDDRPIGRTTTMTNKEHVQEQDIARRDSTCSCGKQLKNEKGLRIHQGKMGCRKSSKLKQRTGTPGETEEEQGQEAHHSAQSLHASEESVISSGEPVTATPSETPVMREAAHNRKGRIQWPTTAERKSWEAFDEDADRILEVTLAGSIEKKVNTMATIMYSMGAERFGIEEEKHGKKPNEESNRRQQQISQIRAELRQLTRAYREAEEEEKPALEELRGTLRSRLKTLRRAENSRRKRKERMKKRAQFTSNPFQFVKKLLGDKRSGRLDCPKEEVEQHLRDTHSDPNRQQELGDCPQLLQPDEPTVTFDESEPKWKEVEDIIKKARASSAPGPNGITYKVYKNCPRLARRLWKTLKVIWRKGRLADSWLIADGCFIPKEDESKDLRQFRTISLLNVEGKICLAVLASRMTKFMMSNNYIDISVQKGGVPGVSGCVEHTAAVTQIIREAKQNKGNLAVVWLDLANAYGSIPHKLVQETLRRYHIPEKVQHLLQHYFDHFKMRFSVGEYTTEWQRLEVGIVTGCTISVTLFAAAMNLIVKSAEKASRGPSTVSGSLQPLSRAFMDDMTITARSVVEGRWTLEDLERLFTWARMNFKPAKSRSLVLRKGKVQDHVRFKIGGAVIPTVTEKPVKSLGKWFTSALNDHQSIREVVATVEEWMKSIDKCGLPGRFKAWCYQHGVLPRVLWPILVYEVPVSTVESMERKISSYLRRWLGVPRSFCSIGLYSSGSKLQLPLKALTEEYKATKVRAVMMLRDSQDQKIRDAGIEIRTGRKWKAEEAVAEAESRLRHQDLVGTVAQGRLGLGCVTRSSWKSANTAERRKLVQEEVRKKEEESRQAQAVTMRKQGSWLHWEAALGRKLNWNDLWRMEGPRVSFLLRSVYDVLPSPTNLCTWGMIEDPSCKLCKRPANLEHVLSSCKIALSDGRYTWRHDQVLKAIAEKLDVARRQTRPVKSKMTYISFQKAGESKGASMKQSQGILATAGDWQMVADIHGRMQFPANIAATNSRPDLVLWSEGTKQVIMLELTVPWEERMEEAHQRKLLKYQQLVEDCQGNGWKARCLPVEVGCRGFAGQSLWQALRLLGLHGMARKKLIAEVCEEAERASRWVWSKREEQWKPT